MLKSVSFPLLFLVLMGACTQKECRESNIPTTAVNIEIERLEQKLKAAGSAAEVLHIIRTNPGFAKGFLDIHQYPSDIEVADRLYALLQDPYIDSLYNDTQAAYSDMEQIKNDLQEGFGRLRSLYPNTKIPKVQTVVTGLYKDLVITDTLIIVGLDHFLGENAKYKPLDVPEYIYRRYDKNHLVPMIISYIGGTYNNADFLNNTMLAEMIDYGKTYYFVSNILPCVHPRFIIGYTAEEWRDSKNNDGIIWANFIENELLYEVNHVLKNKFLGERPKVFEIGDKCPGRIGRWVGLQIVEAYMANNPDISLDQLMEEDDAQKILQGSRYKPKN